MRNLILVESKNKCPTIKSYLKGTPFEDAIIKPSIGHIIEIKDGGKYCNCGIDPEKDFKANYQIAQDKKKIVQELKEQVGLADMIYICSDPDREGEFIAWSLLTYLNIPKEKCKRATFNEISQKAILNGLNNASDIDDYLFYSADARRKLDKILGYRLTPIGRKYLQARSIGRCQSAGLMIVVDREKEIQNFVPQEYWELYLIFKKQGQTYKAKYVGTVNNKENKLSTIDDVKKVIEDCEKSNTEFTISNIVTKEKKVNNKPPFTTSTFQQEVSSRLNIPANKIMQIAQKLSEGINVKGEHIALITYHRTDSDTMADDFKVCLKDFIKNNYGDKYLGTLKQGKKIANAQEAHECLRVTDLSMTPEKLAQAIDDKYLVKVYDIIYKRTVASMMTPEIISETTYEIKNGDHLFNFVSKVQVFDGFKKIYTYDKEDDVSTINFQIGEEVLPINMEEVQKFTQPPARFNEATLISNLEDTGIGRPSTFDKIVDTLIDPSRGYCIVKENRIIPTEKGIQVSDFLNDNFSGVININSTSNMEKSLDEIANGNLDELAFLRDFYTTLEETVDKALKTLNYAQKEVVVAENVKCPLCGADMYIRTGRFGEFYGCSNYPKCKGVINVEKAKDNS